MVCAAHRLRGGWGNNLVVECDPTGRYRRRACIKPAWLGGIFGRVAISASSLLVRDMPGGFDPSFVLF